MKRLLSIFFVLFSIMTCFCQGFETTLKLAQQGDVEAQCYLGSLYYSGYGVDKNYSEALFWYNNAASRGNSTAQEILGYMYAYGKGVERDYNKAMYWYVKAAAQGNLEAQIQIGHMYTYGRGVDVNYSIAMSWYKLAADRGDVNAKHCYEKLKRNGYHEVSYNVMSINQPPLLAVVDGSLTFSDSSSDDCIDANEDCFIKFAVINKGKGVAYDCVTRIHMNGMTTGISIEDIQLPPIGIGETYDIRIPIFSDINTQNGQITFTIEISEPNGWGVAPFDLTVATKAYDPPYLQVVDYTVFSSVGKIRKMEPFTLTFNLQNTKYGDAEDVKVKVNLPNNVFVMDGNAEMTYTQIKSGEVKPIQLTLAANNNYPTTNIPITIDIKEKYGKFAENKQLDIALNQATHSTINIAAKDEPQTERKEIKLAMIKSEVDRNIPTTNTKNPNTFVLIIANEHYSQVASVPFALNDGNIFREYCIKTLGIGEKHIKYLSDATGNQIKSGVNWLANLTEAFDEPQIIVYYAGHGIPDEANKSAYLLPVDGSGTDVTTGYKLDNLYTTLGKMPASQITVFMDACFSGSKREQGMLASARGVALKAKSGVPQGNMVVFSAAQGDETAYPNREQQHGLFTYYLLKKLQETQGDIALKDLGDYITKQVSQQSLLINDKKQTPCVIPSASLGTEWQSWKLK